MRTASRSAQSLNQVRRGLVTQISTSQGGVPKLSVERAIVTHSGIEGDKQANRRFHGGPDKALCLWSQEVIEDLIEEGHDIAPGHAGENLTIQGFLWALVGPGTLIRVGEVMAEVTAFARPCNSNARWFLDGDFNRINQTINPGSSRVYARVLAEGVIVRDMEVQILD